MQRTDLLNFSLAGLGLLVVFPEIAMWLPGRVGAGP
jgi:hypothetical protein